VVKLTDNSKEKEESKKKLIEKAAIPVIIRHKNWEEFKSNAENASAISFLLREKKEEDLGSCCEDYVFERLVFVFLILLLAM